GQEPLRGKQAIEHLPLTGGACYAVEGRHQWVGGGGHIFTLSRRVGVGAGEHLAHELDRGGSKGEPKRKPRISPRFSREASGVANLPISEVLYPHRFHVGETDHLVNSCCGGQLRPSIPLVGRHPSDGT